MYEGQLQIGVFSESIARPASGAIVRVVGHNAYDDSEIILDELTPDESGQTPVTEIEAPPLELSLTPESEATAPQEDRPYSDVDLHVFADGYIPMIIKGVQILPDVTALQQVKLQPVTSAYYANTPRIITIKEHTLWGEFPPKYPEDEVKELPLPTGEVVLPEPVIPEYIVVHDGRPENTTAPNYWIPFTDYIKNVACCEIYPTWPRNTIIANVLVIVSFTLNRVFTEWYRGKGYDFTITSSTSFDQAFSYGRNFFTEISEVVDEVFNTYITRPGIRQPLFTQYCDGKRVVCPGWLSQWGSKTLGDQGWSALNILKNYYGWDIYLNEAQKVEGVPVSWPRELLQYGMSGEPVRIIQEQLNAIANNFPNIQKLPVTGYFGDMTKAAVLEFQRTFNLPETGTVGFTDWYRISHIYVSVTKMAASL